VNVLIVEDDLPIAHLLWEALELGGYNVCQIARTLDEAMAEAEKIHPDYAIVDVHLADGSLGTDFARLLRTSQNTIIIFSTGNDGVTNFAEQEGNAVMTKPYLMRDVIQGLKICDEIARRGETDLKYPRNFRLIGKCDLTGATERTASPCFSPDNVNGEQFLARGRVISASLHNVG
jgi:two-component system, response regulator PdtaR